MQLNFIKRLTLLMGLGIENLSQSLRKNVGDYIWSQQKEDGGFAGRSGSGEIYYTSFALRTLALLGMLSDDIRTRHVFQFLNHYLQKIKTFDVSEDDADFNKINLSGVDLTSLLYAAQLLEWTLGQDIFAWNSLSKKDFAIQIWKQYEHSDGGFASSVRSSQSSIYQSFLAGVTSQLNDWSFSNERHEKLETFLLGQQRSDGGFADLPILRNSGTNPTVAALGLLEILQNNRDQIKNNQNDSCEFNKRRQIIAISRAKAVQFLLSQQLTDGGFRAHQKMPCSDLLSSFSAFVGVAMFYGNNIDSMIDLPSLNDYVDSLYDSSGSFRGGIWDHETDTEYAFYGIALKSMITTCNNH